MAVVRKKVNQKVLKEISEAREEFIVELIN